MSRILKAADLFCGAGGTSTGAMRAARRLGVRLDLLAVNHWDKAVRTHELNHPTVRHLCADLNAVDPLKVSTKLDLLCASPECTHHSNARGGKPMDDQSRASAWHVLHWLDKTQAKALFLENVREFVNWCPLSRITKRPIKRLKGTLFRSFVTSLEALDYSYEWRLVNAANHGGATARVRFILMALKRGRIVWPDQTHAQGGENGLKRWRAAREIIDWSIPGMSIHERGKYGRPPLKPNTLRRIEAGLRKFCGEAFIVCLRGTSAEQLPLTALSVEDPLPTITAGGGHHTLVEPFLIHLTHQGERSPHSINKPLPTITTAKRGEMALVQPFLLPQLRTKRGRDCTPARSVEKPLQTVTASCGGITLVEPFLVKYYGTGIAKPLSVPLDTVTTKARYMLVMPDGSKARLDIRTRMLQPHELAAAMGFDAGYQFEGNLEEQIKQIGNAVEVNLADAHCGALMAR